MFYWQIAVSRHSCPVVLDGDQSLAVVYQVIIRASGLGIDGDVYEGSVGTSC